MSCSVGPKRDVRVLRGPEETWARRVDEARGVLPVLPVSRGQWVPWGPWGLLGSEARRALLGFAGLSDNQGP